MSNTEKQQRKVPRISYRQVLKRKHQSKNPQLTKRYVKFLSVCRDPKLTSALVRKAPDSVIKRICDAALNAANGQIPIGKLEKSKFQRKRKLFTQLIDRRVPIARKRRALSSQRGGALPLIPILLSTVLGSLGSLLFKQ